MSKLTTLLHGDLSEVVTILANQTCTEAELRAALANVIGRVQAYERSLVELAAKLATIQNSGHRRAFTTHISGAIEYRDACQDCARPWSDHFVAAKGAG